MEATIDVVRAFFADHELVPKNDRAALGENDSLLDSGLIDSLSLLKLVTYLEERLHLKIQDGDLIPENFDTLNAIVSLVEKRRA
jgi:acyl carrier protein